MAVQPSHRPSEFLFLLLLNFILTHRLYVITYQVAQLIEGNLRDLNMTMFSKSRVTVILSVRTSRGVNGSLRLRKTLPQQTGE